MKPINRAPWVRGGFIAWRSIWCETVLIKTWWWGKEPPRPCPQRLHFRGVCITLWKVRDNAG